MNASQPYQVGAQSYSFRSFDFEGSIRCLNELGTPFMEYCGVHLPCDPHLESFPRMKKQLEEAGVIVLCYGVEGFASDTEQNRKRFELAKALGAKVLTADPAPESFDNLDQLTEEYGIRIGIHNHGPNARYDKVTDTLQAIKDHSPLIGACVDTGHVIRSGEKPHEVIEQLGNRVHALHLKDWKQGGEEQILGEGDMDIVAVARVLRAIGFSGPIIMEYENSPSNPVPEMKIGLANWFAACAAV